MLLHCDVCGRILTEPGALLFSPPANGTCSKWHICVTCFEDKAWCTRKPCLATKIGEAVLSWEPIFTDMEGAVVELERAAINFSWYGKSGASALFRIIAQVLAQSIKEG